MSHVIRKATEKDVDKLVIIRNEALAFKLSHGDLAWEEAPFTKEEMLAAVARDRTYLMLVDDEPAGSVVCTGTISIIGAKKDLTTKLVTSLILPRGMRSVASILVKK
jgi:hypothetical protein